MAATAHMNLEDEDDAIATINIIPFVDIVLVLLIIFMVTSTAIVRQAFQVDLPKAASAGQGVESTLNLVLDKEGELFLNGETTKREELAAYVREEAEKTEKLQAVIAADTASQYGEIVALIDLVKQNGVQSFALNIERDVDATSAQ